MNKAGFHVAPDRLIRWARFGAGGMLNTALTYGIYLVLHLFLGYQVSYLLAYVSGIVFSYFFNTLVVFRTQLSLKRFLAFPSVYLVQYVASALLLGVLVEKFGISKSIAPLIIIFILIPLTYLLSKTVLTQSRRSLPTPHERES